MITHAVIVAAGQGRRFGPAGKLMSKGLLKVGHEQLVPRSIRLLRAAGIRHITIGVGHLADQYRNAFAGHNDITCVRNDRYRDTSSMGTLAALRGQVTEDFLLLESDLLYEPRALTALLSHSASTVVLVSQLTNADDAYFVSQDARGNLTNISNTLDETKNIAGEFVGITKISQKVFAAICDFWDQRSDKQPGMHSEEALVGIRRSVPIAVHRENKLVWCEIDTIEHRERAQRTIIPALAVVEDTRGMLHR